MEIFWSVYQKNLAAIAGLNNDRISELVIMETYPRYVIKRLWPEQSIPSKTKSTVEYIRKISALITQKGYYFDENKVTSHDLVDAMLCAIAAEDYKQETGSSAGKAGRSPLVDNKEGVLREGFIYSP